MSHAHLAASVHYYFNAFSIDSSNPMQGLHQELATLILSYHFCYSMGNCTLTNLDRENF